MTPGGFRIDLAAVPVPVLMLFVAAIDTLRSEWTMSPRLLEIVRLASAFEHDCHT